MAMANGVKASVPASMKSFDALALVAMLWAAQTLIQLTNLFDWQGAAGIAGWITFALGVAVLFNPRNLRLFLALIVAASTRYIISWPDVSNHLMLDAFLSLAILGSVAMVAGRGIFGRAPIDADLRDRIFDTFMPIVIALFALMYYWIVISKMNWDFANGEISCMHAMYSYYINRQALMHAVGSRVSIEFLWWLFMIVEWALPIMLTFRRTRLLAVYIGIPFHLMLGTMGHYWYSSLVIALYGMVAARSIVSAAGEVAEKIGAAGQRSAVLAYRAFVAAAAVLFATSVILAPSTGLMGVKVEVLLWIVPAGLVSLAILGAVAWEHYRSGIWNAQSAPVMASASPGLLWGIVALMCLNSLSPYIGYRTTGSISMYSNLRTEGGENNHMFMPTIAIFGFQNDLVEIIDSNNKDIMKLAGYPVLYGDPNVSLPVKLTYFELRRAVSHLADDDLWIKYTRNGQERVFDEHAASNVDGDLDRPMPIWLEKTARFRPIFKDRSYCQH